MKLFTFLTALLLTVLIQPIRAEYSRVASYEGNFASQQVVGDINNNGFMEIYEGHYSIDTGVIVVREYNNNFEFTTTYLPFYAVPWGIGDINSNGLPDMVCQSGDPFGGGGNGYLRIYEAPHMGSFPTRLIAQVTLPGRQHYYYARITDLDQDGKNEVLMSPNSFFGGGMRIYEWGDGTLKLVWEYTGGYCVTNIVGDFNRNGKMDFAFFELNSGTIKVFECVGDNDYQQIYQYQYPYSVGMGGAATVLDLDGDGQDEFLFGISSSGAGYRYLVFHYNGIAYELWFNVGDNTGYYGGVSATAGDFDGDGRDEFVVSIYPKAYVYDYNPKTGQLEKELLDSDIDILAFQSGYFDEDIYEDIYAVSYVPDSRIMSFYEYSLTGIKSTLIKKNHSGFKIYPTISKGILNIIGQKFETFDIYDINGTFKISVNVGKQKLNLPAGIYVVISHQTGEKKKIVILK